MDILFPSSPERRTAIDPSFESEQRAAISHGFGFSLYSHEAVESGQPAAVLNQPKSGRRYLLRGWMITEAQHRFLAEAVQRAGSELVVDTASYAEAHYLPNAYQHLYPETAESIWLEGDEPAAAWGLYQQFRDKDALIKDWVKSAKHRWRDACFLPAGTDQVRFAEIFTAFRQARGHLFNRGVVFRRFVPLASKGVDMRGFPLVEEFRLFYFCGDLVALPSAEGAEAVLKESPRWTALARKFRSPFMTIDVARLDSGNWIVVEAGDGGVSGLPLSIDPLHFYRALAAKSPGAV